MSEEASSEALAPAGSQPVEVAGERLFALATATGSGLALALDARGALVGMLRVPGAPSASAVRDAACEIADLRPLTAASLDELARGVATGDESQATAWRGIAEEHAAALGLPAPLASRRLNAIQRLIVIAQVFPDDVLAAARTATRLTVDVTLVNAEDDSVAWAPKRWWERSGGR